MGGITPRVPGTTSVVAPERIMSIDKLISSAQLLALNATPVSLVPAPPTSFALVFEGAVIHKPAGTAYAGIAAGEHLSVKYTDASGLQVTEAESDGFLDQTTAQTRFLRPFAAASGAAELAIVSAAALVLHLLSGEITTGNSALHVRTFYRIVPAFAFAS